MANTWGNDRTGYDKQLHEIGATLQNIESIETLQIVIAKLERIRDKMAKARSVETLRKLRESI